MGGGKEGWGEGGWGGGESGEAGGGGAEISPEFSFDPQGGPKRDGALIITAEQRRGLHGCWQRTFAVTGGDFYRFEALRKTDNVQHPRRSASVRIPWQHDAGNALRFERPDSQGYLTGWQATAAH